MQAEPPLFQARSLVTRLGGRLIDFSLQAHEILTVTGASGSGKTLFLRALADLDPHQGGVFLRGRPQSSFKPAEWRSRVVLVAAESAWWSSCVADHFQHQPSAGQIEALGLSRDVLRWPVTRLSSGERQRLALLRALVLTPVVLLLDEPTANLDDENSRKTEMVVLEYLRTHTAAAVWVSHDSAQRERLHGKVLVMA